MILYVSEVGFISNKINKAVLLFLASEIDNHLEVKQIVSRDRQLCYSSSDNGAAYWTPLT